MGVLIAVGFDLSRLNTESYAYKNFPVDGEFRNIEVRAEECDIRLTPAEDGPCRVVTPDSDGIVTRVEVSGDTLTVIRTDTRRWYERIGFFWWRSAGEPLSLTVYLPETEYESVLLKSVSGNIAVPALYTFACADVQTTSGNIEFAAHTDGLNVRSTSGDIDARNVHGGALKAFTVSGNIELNGIVCDSWNVQTTSGDIDAEAVTVSGAAALQTTSGDITLLDVTAGTWRTQTTSGYVHAEFVLAEGAAQWKSVSGDLTLLGTDAAAITIETVSGNVDGRLCSGKTFLTETTSGDIRVPASDPAGGECRITTVSGDVRLITDASVAAES